MKSQREEAAELIAREAGIVDATATDAAGATLSWGSPMGSATDDLTGITVPERIEGTGSDGSSMVLQFNKFTGVRAETRSVGYTQIYTDSAGFCWGTNSGVLSPATTPIEKFIEGAEDAWVYFQASPASLSPLYQKNSKRTRTASLEFPWEADPDAGTPGLSEPGTMQMQLQVLDEDESDYESEIDGVWLDGSAWPTGSGWRWSASLDGMGYTPEGSGEASSLEECDAAIASWLRIQDY